VSLGPEPNLHQTARRTYMRALLTNIPFTTKKFGDATSAALEEEHS
jgi:hypothetical protein